ncbi:hypothetical protein CBL_20442 [Carabus blaptoides fortunei]
MARLAVQVTVFVLALCCGHHRVTSLTHPTWSYNSDNVAGLTSHVTVYHHRGYIAHTMDHNNNQKTLNSNSRESLNRRLQMSTEFFLVPRTTTTPTARPPVSSITTSKTGAGGVRRVTATSVFRTEAWVAPVVAQSTLEYVV